MNKTPQNRETFWRLLALNKEKQCMISNGLRRIATRGFQTLNSQAIVIKDFSLMERRATSLVAGQ